MRITHCLMSCDSNPYYLDFWPVVARAWLKFGIQPVLFYIATDKSVFPAAVDDCPVYVFDPISRIPIFVQTSALRYWGSRLYRDDIVIVSDIDLIPLSKKFFIDRLHEVDDDDYVHIPPWAREIPDGNGDYGRLSPEYLPPELTDRPEFLIACYHIARGEHMKRIWKFSSFWEESCRMMAPYYYKIKGRGLRCGEEVYSSIMVGLAAQKGERIKLLPYRKKEFDCMQRNIVFNEEPLRTGYWSALHAPCPYGKHHAEIDRLLQMNDEFL